MSDPTNSRKGEKRRQWDQASMDMALQDIRNNNMKPSEASKIYKIPRKTLTDRISKNIKDDCKAGGAGTYLSAEHELSLCSYIEYMATRGFPLTVSQVIMYAWVIDKTKGQNKFGDKGPCYGWWLGFKARHPESAKLRKPDSLDRGRALFSTVNNLREYFQLLKSVLDEGDFLNRPQDIYNCDETVVDLNKSSQKVVVPRRFKTSHSRQVASSEHITIHCCISAAGSTIPPFIIYKAAFPGGNYTAGGPDGALYAKQKTGFMDSELFVKWFTKLFIPHARPTPERSVLLLVDGHSSHCSPDLIHIARENNVILLALAPHTTHLCQPLDVAVYRSFKIHLSKLVKFGQALRGDLWIAKSNVGRVLKQPFEACMTIQNIKSGFKKCGIFPFNPNAIDKTQLFRNKLIPSEDVDLSVPPNDSNSNEDTNVQDINNNEDSNVPDININEDSNVIDHNINDDCNVADDLNMIDYCNVTDDLNINDDCNVTEDLEQSSSQPIIILEDIDISSTSLPSLLNEDDIIHIDNIDLNYVDDVLPDLTLSNFSPDSSVINNPVPTDNSNIEPNKPMKFHMFSKYAKTDDFYDVGDTISLVPTCTMVDAGTQTEEVSTGFRPLPSSNVLVTSGIVSKDLAEIFTPPDEKIPAGRKRPLRTKSKARVMTSQEVIDDLLSQQQEIDSRIARREAAAQRGRGRGRGGRGRRPQNSRQREDTPLLSTPRRPSNRVANINRNIVSEDENECYICNINFYNESRVNKNKWVGCEGNGCPHWICPRCLPSDFDYNAEYFCDICA